MTHDVFVSYPTRDRLTADAVVNALESQGVRCWYAPRDVGAGVDWVAAIVAAIRNARTMVLVMSDAANTSDHILREVRQAADASLPIVPFRTTPDPPSESLQYYLGGTHWLDALTPPLKAHLGRLTATVEGILQGGQIRVPDATPANAALAADGPGGRRGWMLAVGAAALAAAVAVTLVVMSGGGDPSMSTSSVAAAPEEPAATTAAAPEPLVVCQVNATAGTYDSPFFTDAWKGVQEAIRSGYASEDSVLREGPTEIDGRRIIGEFAAVNCELVVVVGVLLADAVADAAAEHPDVLFVAVDSKFPDPPENLRYLDFRSEEASFLAGYLAAGMTDSGVVGVFGGYDIPPVNALLDGFMWGVEEYNRIHDDRVFLLGWGSDSEMRWYIGTFDSLAEGARATSFLLDEAADVVFPVAGTAGLGASPVASEAGDVALIGVDADGYYTDPEYGSLYLTSVLKNIDVGVLAAIVDAAAGRFDSEPFVGTLENGGVSLAVFHDYEVPEALGLELDALSTAVKLGAIEVGGG